MIHTKFGDFPLKYTYNAIAEYEERFKRNIVADCARVNFHIIRCLLWAGLLHTGRSFSLNEVGDMIENMIMEGADLVDIREEVEKALDEAVFIKRLAEKTMARQAEKRQGNPSAK